MSVYNPLKIKEVIRETPKAVSLCFEVPDDLKDVYKFTAGQYLGLEAVISGKLVRRDYSISSSPSSGNLTVTIKEIEKGLFSSFANKKIRNGDYLKVAPPKGRFVYNPSKETPKNIIAFAAGSGITPIMSIIKTVLTANKDHKCVLIYGNKSADQTIFYNALLALQSNYKERLKIQLLFSNENATDALSGRIDKENIVYTLKNCFDIQQDSTYYICGPEDMIHTVKDVLINHRVPENKILFELFTAAESKQTKNIEAHNGDVKATIVFEDETTTIRVKANMSLLEAALAEDIEVPYSCQGGVCSSCICRVTKGSAIMKQNSVLTDDELAEGLILSCQAVPSSSEIELDFDDV